MSGSTKLAGPITGYTVSVFKNRGAERSPFVVTELDLKLSKVGGAHITNAESLIMMLEDAVFDNEEYRHDELDY